MRPCCCVFAVLFTFPLSAQKALTDGDLVSMFQAGTPTAGIITAIAEAPVVEFNFLPGYLTAMTNAGVPDDVIRAMAARTYGRPIPGYKPEPKNATASNATEILPQNDKPAATTRAISTPPVPFASPFVPVASPGNTAPSSRPAAIPSIAPPNVSPTIIAPTGSLSDDEVDRAIQMSLTSRRPVGLRLNDVQTSLISAVVCRTCAQSGYTLTIYTPEEWIEFEAQRARRELLPFTVADATAEMRLPNLHVLALPNTPAYITGPSLSRSSSVHRVVLSDTARQITIQPLHLRNGSVESNSALRSATFRTAAATFSMSDVQGLRSSDPKGEFFVVVVGDNQNKYFKVKTKDFKALFGSTVP